MKGALRMHSPWLWRCSKVLQGCGIVPAGHCLGSVGYACRGTGGVIPRQADRKGAIGLERCS